MRITIEMLAGQAGLIVLRGELGGWQVRVTEGIIPAFLDELKPLLLEIPDTEDPEEFEIPEVNRVLNKLTFAASLGLLSGVGLPMVTQKKVLGVVFIFRSYPGVFSTNDRNVLSSFASQAAIAVQNAQMYQTITTNKKYLDVKLVEELKEYQESGSIEELADLVEVVYAILNYMGISLKEFEEIRRAKVNKRGAFDKRLLLKEVTEL